MNTTTGPISKYTARHIVQGDIINDGVLAKVTAVSRWGSSVTLHIEDVNGWTYFITSSADKVYDLYSPEQYERVRNS